MLWDLPEKRRKRVLNALRDRLLVKVSNEGYYLHPVIREEAIARCRESEDWKIANCKAAEFWTENIQTVKLTADSLRALEAYYYYIHIQEFEQAAKVLIKERSHRWGADVAIGRSIYRLKFLKQMIAVISSVVNHINSEYSLCKLYNILGDMYWLKGSMQEAIEYHSKSGKIAIKYNTKFKSKNQCNNINELEYIDCFENYSLFNLGLCQLNLGELEQADYFF